MRPRGVLTPTEWEPESGDGLCPCRCMVAGTALLMATLPPEANMLEAIVLPIKQKYMGKG